MNIIVIKSHQQITFEIIQPDKLTKLTNKKTKKIPEIRLRAVSNLAQAETQHKLYNFTNIQSKTKQIMTNDNAPHKCMI